MNQSTNGPRPLFNPMLQSQQGMVLIAVLWMVAALSILVTGMTRSVREEVRTLALARQSCCVVNLAVECQRRMRESQ